MNQTHGRSLLLVNDQTSLTLFEDDFLPQLDGQVIGLDIEEDREYGYLPVVALIQITLGTMDVVLDPVALGHAKLSAVVESLCLTPELIVMHGCNNDVTGLKRDWGVGPQRLYDTQVAARFAGCERFGLSALLQEKFGVELNKSVRRSNWRERPLTDELLQYAREDTVWLIALRDQLHERAVAAGWEDAIHEENEVLSSLRAESVDFEPWGWRRMKGIGSLSPQGSGRMHQLWAWRDDLGHRTDRHPQRVIPNWMLVELAERGSSALDSMLRNGPSSLGRHRGALQALLDAAPALAGDERNGGDGLNRRGRRSPTYLSAAMQQRLDALTAWRDRTAQQTGLEASWLASRGLLEGLARLTEPSPRAIRATEGVREWRVRRYLDDWLPILERYPV